MSEAAFTLDAIRPLVKEADARGRQLTVLFSCPASGETVRARWQAPRGNPNTVSSQVKRRAKQTAWYEVRRQVHGLIRSVLGHGAMGRIAGDVVSSAMHAQQRSRGTARRELSQAERDQGVLEAFRTVSSQFAWIQGQWVHASHIADLLSPFEEQLHRHPIRTEYDRLLTTRMLVEVANSHGGIGDDEKIQLSDSLDPEHGSLEALIDRPPLSGAELEEASAGDARITMLAVAWSLALCDERLARPESALLDRFATGLGLRPAQAVRARELAQGLLMDQALERAFSWGDHDQAARDTLVALGERIGMSREQVELAEARFQKRRSG